MEHKNNPHTPAPVDQPIATINPALLTRGEAHGSGFSINESLDVFEGLERNDEGDFMEGCSQEPMVGEEDAQGDLDDSFWFGDDQYPDF